MGDRSGPVPWSPPYEIRNWAGRRSLQGYGGSAAPSSASGSLDTHRPVQDRRDDGDDERGEDGHPESAHGERRGDPRGDPQERPVHHERGDPERQEGQGQGEDPKDRPQDRVDDPEDRRDPDVGEEATRHRDSLE